MKRVSKNTAVKIAAGLASSALTGAAVQVIYSKPSAASAAAAAVLFAQSNAILTSVSLGGAVSSSKRDIINAVAKLGKSTHDANALEMKLKKALGENRDAISTKLTAALSKPVTAVANSTLGKSALSQSTKSYAAADPKQRRTGAPAPNFTKPELMVARMRAPISGKAAEKWIASRTGGDSFTPQNSNPAFRSGSRPFAKDIPVAMIADEFTFHSFKDEFDSVRLHPKNWREQFEKHQPQMFFCESAWQGGTPQEHPWQAKIYASVRWPKENRGELLEILDYCHKKGIPTVFWNKEDPTHFEDRINDFVRTAALFDYVFTTAEECIDSYIKNVGCNHADVLPFAVQPRLFNPQGIVNAQNTANFAGTWYANYPQRCEAASTIMDSALEAGLGLLIYDRMYESTSPRHAYPEKYAGYTRPAIPYVQTAQAFKESKYGITLNTVDDSNSMFARRVFELAASGSVVLSNSAKGVRNFFGDSVLYPDVDPHAIRDLSDSDYRRLQSEAMSIALDNTYTDRAETILKTVGIDFQPAVQAPTAFAAVRTMAEYERYLAKLSSSKAFEKGLISVTHDADQSLEFKIGMRHDPGITVIRDSDLHFENYRVRSFLDTPGAVVLDPAGDWPEVEEINNLLRHSQHFDGVISPATDVDKRYVTTDALIDSGSYVPANLASSLASNAGPTATFNI